MNRKRKVLVISHDKVGKSMAGPGMRYHQIATVLSNYFDVTLAVFNPSYIDDLNNVPYKKIDVHVHRYQSIFKKYEVIFALWLSPEMIRFCKDSGVRIVMDLYAPGPVEELVSSHYSHSNTKKDDLNYTSMIETQKFFFQTADMIVCSNPVQKDFWTGFAFASNAILPSTYDAFDLEKNIEILPMGINKEELSWIDGSDPVRYKFKNIKEKDHIIVWTGGIWDWFDSETPIKAMKILKDAGRNDIKLVFLGTKHPNNDVPEMDETLRAHELAESYNLKNNTVFFLEGWLPYRERLNYLASARAALYSHKPTIEARYSHRTRVLDHILTCLPTIATLGDFMADIIENNKLGLSVIPLDEKEMSDAIVKICDDDMLYNTIRSNIDRCSDEYTWARTTTPLKNFINTDAKIRPQVKPPETNITRRPSYQLLIGRIIPRSIKELIKEYLWRS